MLGIMAQGVRRGPAFAGEIGCFDGVGEGADQDMGGDGAGPSAIGKQPAPVAMVLRRPHSAQALVDRLGHRHDAFLVALADDSQQAAGLVDGGDGESSGFADAQAARRHDVNSNQLFRWRRQLLPKAAVESAMVPVEILMAVDRRGRDREGIIELTFGCEARVRLRGEVSSETLREVIELLR